MVAGFDQYDRKPPRCAERRGSLTGITVSGMSLGLHPSGAVWLEDEELLVLSDLHLETASHHAARGSFWPPCDSAATLERLDALVHLFRPRTVVALGDNFHDPGGTERLPESCRAMIFNMQLQIDWIWITGNHDPGGPGDLGGEVHDTVRVGRLHLRHIPGASPVAGEICGHLHPCARIRDRGHAMRRRCFISDGRRLILPAFGALAGGLNVLDPAFHDLFDERICAVYLLGENTIHQVSFNRLRPDEPGHARRLRECKTHPANARHRPGHEPDHENSSRGRQGPPSSASSSSPASSMTAFRETTPPDMFYRI